MTVSRRVQHRHCEALSAVAISFIGLVTGLPLGRELGAERLRFARNDNRALLGLFARPSIKLCAGIFWPTSWGKVLLSYSVPTQRTTLIPLLLLVMCCLAGLA